MHDAYTNVLEFKYNYTYSINSDNRLKKIFLLARTS